ncbi:MAG: HAMP domain-containing protein [Gemmatimonadales bacterium]
MTAEPGRFDRSFVIRMIRDFVVALTAIVVLELGGRAVLAWRDFQTREHEATKLAAERLASDVRDIMLNEGGPVAARTVYPILRRNHEGLGYEIAIEPSAITIESIRRAFGFEPRGIPPAWSEGAHHETAVDLAAEQFCRTCHVMADIGDVLGRVTVRSYRAHKFAEFWREARLVSVVGMANVILHTIVLFLLLRLRMEPLLRLRSTMARLAKGHLDLSQRTDVRSDDEFGELADDLNHFLERVSDLVGDLDAVLSKLVAVNTRLAQVSQRMGGQRDALQGESTKAREQAAALHQLVAGPSTEALEAVELVLAALEDQAAKGGLPEGPVTTRLRGVLERFRALARRGEEATVRTQALQETLSGLSRRLRDDTHYQGEIMVLEEHMRVVSETGTALLRRLKGVEASRAVDREGTSV